MTNVITHPFRAEVRSIAGTPFLVEGRVIAEERNVAQIIEEGISSTLIVDFITNHDVNWSILDQVDDLVSRHRTEFHLRDVYPYVNEETGAVGVYSDALDAEGIRRVFLQVTGKSLEDHCVAYLHSYNEE